MRATPSTVLRIRKSLGQHFLMHPRIAERIVKVAELPFSATVLEIGPGKGILTRELLKRVKKVVAVEVDLQLCAKLQNTFAAEIKKGQLELIHDDIRDYPLSHTTVRIKGYHVVANIPYYLTGEIMRMFLEAKNQPASMTLLVQKEVAERVARSNPDAKRSGPRPKRRGKESVLSLSVKVYGTPKYEFTVPRGAFLPAPNVDSAVLTIRDISRKNFKTHAEEKRFFELIHAGFAHKRKFVRNNLATAGLSAGAIPEKARAEDLPLSDWLMLSSLHTPTH